MGERNNHNRFDKNVSRILGGGEDTLFWSNCWVGVALKRTFDRVFFLSLKKEATMAKLREDRGNTLWNFCVEERPH